MHSPQPTRDEVLAVFAAEEYVFTAGEVAERIFRLRGGQGDPRTIKGHHQRQLASVLPVARTQVRNLLKEMTRTGTLASAVGDEASRLGLVSGCTRDGTLYFALGSSARVAAARHAEQTRGGHRAAALAITLSAMDSVLGVQLRRTPVLGVDAQRPKP